MSEAVDRRQRIRDCEPDSTPYDASCGGIVVNPAIESVEARSLLAGGKADAYRAIPFVFVVVRLRKAPTRAARPALTVLDVRRLPVMLSMGRAGNHPGDTAYRRRIAGGERPLDRLVDIAFALAAVRMLLSIPVAHSRLHGADCRTRRTRIRLAACGRPASVECRRSRPQHRPDLKIPLDTVGIQRVTPDIGNRARSQRRQARRQTVRHRTD